MRSMVAHHKKLTTNLKMAIIEADPLTNTWEVAEDLNVNHSMVI